MTTWLGFPPNYLISGKNVSFYGFHTKITYESDIPLDPSQSLSLIQQSNIQVSVSPDQFTRQKPKDTDAIVDGDKDNTVIRSSYDFGTIDVRVCIGRKASALDEEPDGEIGRRRSI